MGVRILEDRERGIACFYCSTTDWAFGSLMKSYEEAEEFLEWLGTDPRSLTDSEHRSKYNEFMSWKEEKEKEEM